MTANAKLLRVRVHRGSLVISIPVETLAFAVEHAPQFQVERAGSFVGPKVTNAFGFAADVLRALCDEAEDGTTPVHALIDAAAQKAMEDGSCNVRLPEDR